MDKTPLQKLSGVTMQVDLGNVLGTDPVCLEVDSIQMSRGIFQSSAAAQW